MDVSKGLRFVNKIVSHVKWNFYYSLFLLFNEIFFLIFLLGYGNRYPKTTSGRYFCIIFAGYLVSVLCTSFVRMIKRSEAFILRLRTKASQNKDNNKRNQYKSIRTIQSVMTTFIFLIFLWLLPSIIVMEAQDWDFETALYFCFITISTIGLGDVTPEMSVDPLELDDNKAGGSFKQVPPL